MKRFSALGLLSALLVGLLSTAIQPAMSDTLCNDGWVSPSSGQGTCSWHGGVAGGGSSDKNAKKYKSCEALRKTYRHGVASSIYRVVTSRYYPADLAPRTYSLNRAFDTNKNGLVCEVLDPSRRPYSNTSSSNPINITVPAPIPTPDPNFIGSIQNPAQIGQTAELDGYAFKVTGQIKDVTESFCSRIPSVGTVDGCLYERDQFGSIQRALGPNPSRSKMWIELPLEVQATTNALHHYPLAVIDYIVYTPGGSLSYRWDSVYEPSFYIGDQAPWFSPFMIGERRQVLMHLSVSRDFIVQNSALVIVPIGRASDKRYFYPLK